jgi:hypothetical protein
MDDPRQHPRSRARDAGLARLRRATRVVLLGATALAGAFAGLAAHSVPGHKAGSAAARTTTRVRTVRVTTQAQTTTRGTTTTVAPAPPPAPTTTTVAPVVTSGGS